MSELKLDQCYHPKGTREFDRNSLEGLRKSLNHCHAVNQALIRELTAKDKVISTLRQAQKWDRRWIKAIGTALAISGTIIGWLASHLYDCMTAVNAVMR